MDRGRPAGSLAPNSALATLRRSVHLQTDTLELALAMPERPSDFRWRTVAFRRGMSAGPLQSNSVLLERSGLVQPNSAPALPERQADFHWRAVAFRREMSAGPLQSNSVPLERSGPVQPNSALALPKRQADFHWRTVAFRRGTSAGPLQPSSALTLPARPVDLQAPALIAVAFHRLPHRPLDRRLRGLGRSIRLFGDSRALRPRTAAVVIERRLALPPTLQSKSLLSTRGILYSSRSPKVSLQACRCPDSSPGRMTPGHHTAIGHWPHNHCRVERPQTTCTDFAKAGILQSLIIFRPLI